MKYGVAKVVGLAVLSVIISGFYAGDSLLQWIVDGDCNKTLSQPLFSSDGTNSARLQTEICTGPARRSNFEIDLAENSGGFQVVFAQEGPAAPVFNWEDRRAFKIEIHSTENVYLSLHTMGKINIKYYIPKALSRQGLTEKLEEYRKKMIPLIEQGRVDLSGGDVSENLKNLDENVQRQLTQYDGFFRWLSSNHVQIQQDVKGR